jgi:hypothetical protein
MICLAGVLVSSALARAGDSQIPGSLPPGNPYGSIVKRNVFGLNPIPPPQISDTPSGPPPPKITLTGIMTIFGPPEALFKVSGVVRPGKPPQDESYIFIEGEAQDDVEVTTIDTNKDIVTFNNHGVVQAIPLTAGVATTGSAPPSPTFARPFGGRFPGRGIGPGGPGGPGGFQRQFGNGNNDGSHPAVGPPSGLSGDDQQALIAAQHAMAVQQGDPNAALFPPSPYDKDATDLGNQPTPDTSPTTPTTPTRRFPRYQPPPGP